MARYIETRKDENIRFVTKDSITGRVLRVGEFDFNGGGVVLGSAGVFGISGNQADNVKLHRGASELLQVLKGDDSEFDGVASLDSNLAVMRGIRLAEDISNFTATTRSDVVINNMSGSQIDQAGSVSSIKSYITSALIPQNQEILNLQTFDSPIGVIYSWMGGYFTAAGNGGSYIDVLGGGVNTIAAANAYLNPHGYYVCNGVAVNVSGSAVFNGPGRYVPDLTDSRFIQGSTSFGAIGGSNNLTDHTHTFSLSRSHSHTLNHAHTDTSAPGGYHSHVVSEDIHSHGTNIYRNQGGGTHGPEVEDVHFDNSNEIFTEYESHAHSVIPESSHTHAVTTPLVSSGVYSGAASTATLSGTVGSGVVATSTENRPKYISALYIIRVK